MPKVLVIEDHEADFEYVAAILRNDQDFVIADARTLVEGMEHLAGLTFDALLLDLSLPDADGTDGLRKIVTHFSQLPIVVLTGLDDQEVAFAALKQGAEDYLIKGQINRDLLVRSIRYAIERKRAEEVIRRTERLASLGTMAAGIAHEINNPILAAWTSAEAARNAVNDPNEELSVTDCLDNVIDAAKRCSEIVRNVLDFARPAGPHEKQSQDVREILNLAVQATAGYARQHGATISSNSSTEPLPSCVNAVQIEQVLTNVLRNAIESGEGVDVGIDAVRNGRQIMITVSDDGCGMSDAAKRKAFDLFYTRGKDQGTGLGLSIAHKIAEEHNGSIEINSAEGSGTRITLRLPMDE